MNDQDKSKSELIKELQQLREDNKKLRKSSGEDISDLKQSVEALKKSQLLLKASLESQRNTLLFSIDQEYKYLYFNKAHSDAMKDAYNMDVSLGMNILDCITSGADRKAAKDNYDRALNGETHSNIRIYGDLMLAHYESFFNPIFNENNEIIGATGLARNISARKQAEEAILKSKQQYDNLVSKIPVGVYILKTKPDGTFALEYVSPRMAEMLDLSIESLLTVKETIFKAIHPDDLDGFARLNQEGIFLKRPFDWKGRVIVKGEIRWLHITSLPEQLESGDILWHGLIVDITRQMQNEAEIQLKNDELINLNATKDKFFSIIAHDLRSPFNSFLGLTEIMAEELPNLTMSQLQEMAAGMNKSATNLFRLLENLLNWSQIQKGTIPFNPEAVQIGLVIGESIEMIQEQAKNKGIEITTDIPDATVVFADSNMLQTIVRNLVSNAIKYTNKGGRIILSIETTDDKNIGIAIRDTGIGMSSEIVDKLFRIDTNANRKGTDGEPSTGLGLLLCKEFVEKHGGKIWVDSEEGIGSTFYFTLPCRC